MAAMLQELAELTLGGVSGALAQSVLVARARHVVPLPPAFDPNLA